MRKTQIYPTHPDSDRLVDEPGSVLVDGSVVDVAVKARALQELTVEVDYKYGGGGEPPAIGHFQLKLVSGGGTLRGVGYQIDNAALTVYANSTATTQYSSV